MERLSKTARIVNRIVRVLRGICFGFAIASVILLGIAAFLPDDQYFRLVSFADMTVNLGNVKLYLTRALEPAGSIRLPICVILLNAAVALGLSGWGLHLLHGILRPMEEQRPFGGSVSGDLRKLGWVTLAGALAGYVLGTAADTLAIGMFDLNELFAPALVAGYSVENEMGLAMLIVPVLLFILSGVFRYGEELQRQLDRTL